MLIRVVTTRADVPRTGEGIAFVHGEIQPQIAAMDGNAGFAMAVDRSSGRYVSIAAWTDAEALEASGHGAPRLIADVARRLHGSEPSVEVFDLVLAHVVKPVRLGYWGRLTRFEVPVPDLARLHRNSDNGYWRCSTAMTDWPPSSCSPTGQAECSNASSGTTACPFCEVVRPVRRNCETCSLRTSHE